MSRPALRRMLALPIQRTCAVTTTNTKTAPTMRSRNLTTHQLLRSVRHRSDDFLHFRDVHHHDSVPRAAIEEASIRSLAHALLASDAKNGVHVDASERRIILIRHPEH